MTEATETPVLAVPAVQVIRFTDRMPLLDRMNTVIDNLQLSNDQTSRTDPRTGAVYNRQLEIPINPWKFRVWMQSTVQSLASNSTTVVHFDGVDYDNVMGWNAGGFYYVVPVGGVWDISWHVNINTTGHGTLGQFQIAAMCVVSRGGSNVYFKQVNVVAGTSAASSVIQTGYDATLTDKFSLVAGDQIQLQVNQFNDLGAALNLSHGGTLGQYVSLAGHLVSG